jgi:hypothetical protein
LVRATDGTRQGIGVLEQIVIGPYAPAGFTEFLDGAKGWAPTYRAQACGAPPAARSMVVARLG